jgi:hypothetical protein
MVCGMVLLVLRTALLEGGDDCVVKPENGAGGKLQADNRNDRDEGKNQRVLSHCLALICGGGAAYDPFVRPTSLRVAGVFLGADAS